MKSTLSAWAKSPSRGLRAGMVTNIDATAQAIRQAVEDAELMADNPKFPTSSPVLPVTISAA